MRMWAPFRYITAAALVVVSIPAAVREAFRKEDSPPDAAASKRRMPAGIRVALITLIGAALVGALGGFLFMSSGVYPIQADRPHIPPVQWLLETGRTRSVQFHSKSVDVRRTSGEEAMSRGLALYLVHCQICHGGPGVPAGQAGRGINPTPPPMVSAAHHWSDAELYWILTRGLKMSGMPSFGVRLTEADRWALVGFMRRLPLVRPAEYQSVAALPAGAASLNLRTGGDYGFAELEQNGNAEQGKRLFKQFGCSSCHSSHDLGNSMVGPDLRKFAERDYVAGLFPNLPRYVAAFIQEPDVLKPGTAMPNLGVQPSEALDLVSYLYSSGDRTRLQGIRRTLSETD
jgi:mono/diheme cytochrome c family protein